MDDSGYFSSLKLLKEKHHEQLQDKPGNGDEQKDSDADSCDCRMSACWDDHDVNGCRTMKRQTSHAEATPVQCTEDLLEVEQKNTHILESSDTEDCSHLGEVDEDIDLPLSAPENRDSENNGYSYKVPSSMWESNLLEIVDKKELRLKFTSAETTDKLSTGQDEIFNTSPLEITQYLKFPSSSRQQFHHQIAHVYMLHSDAPQFPTPFAERQLNEAQSLQEDFHSELKRLATYTDYPPSCPVYVVKLAGNGFVWQSELQSVNCIFCSFHITLSDLREPGIDPVKMHMERSHQCPLIQGGDSGNVPVPQLEHFQNFPQQVSSSNSSYVLTALASENSGGASSPTENSNNNIGRLREASYQPDMATVLPFPVVQQQDTQSDSRSTQVTDNVPLIEQPHHSAAPIPRNGANRSSTNASRQSRAESARTAAPSAESTRSSNSSSPRSSDNLSRSSRSSGSSENAPAAANPASQNSNNRSNISSEVKAEQTKEKKKQKLTYSDLGIFAEKPKRPDMAPIQKRLATYTGKWKESYTQTPKMLADAGLYYTGYADCARCFFCAGGLKNWEAPDNPWIEHARWFPKCGYIRMCKGSMFVEIVQRKNKNKENITLKDVESEIELKKPSTDAIETRNPVAMSSSRGTGKESITITGDVEGAGSGVAVNNLGLDRLEAENEELKSQLTCKICMDEESMVVFLPCGHLVACTHCAITLKNCPLCRSVIKGSVRAHTS